MSCVGKLYFYRIYNILTSLDNVAGTDVAAAFNLRGPGWRLAIGIVLKVNKQEGGQDNNTQVGVLPGASSAWHN